MKASHPNSDDDSLDVEPMLALHRANDGFIAIARKDDDRWNDLFSVSAGHLREMFPSIRKHLVKDSFFSVNAMYSGGYGKSRADNRLPNARRSLSALRYLNACFTDLDGQDLGLTVGQMLGIVIDKQNAGIIPPVSIIAYSGNGIWLFWLLRRSDDPKLPPRAFIEKRELYNDIQRSIQGSLAELKPDAKDAARCSRVPGSDNTSAPSEQRLVRYLIQADENGIGYTYTLDELATRFGVARRKHHPKVQQVIDDETRGNKRHAWQELQALRLRQFQMLLSIRGQFSDGCRNHAAMLYAHFLSKNNVSPPEIMQQVELFGRQCCEPRLSNAEMKGAIKSGNKLRTGKMSIRNQSIADWLGITPAESEKLETWPAATWFGCRRSPHEAPEISTRAERQESRRRLIRQLVGAGGAKVPSLRSMTAKLEELGHEASFVTVRSDYLALGVTKRKHRGDVRESMFDRPSD